MKTDPDVKLIADILDAQMHALGRGGLTWLAGKLGMTLSAARKRSMARGFGLDAPTVRAVLLILATKADRFEGEPFMKGVRKIKGAKFQIDLHQTDGEIVPAWKKSVS